MSRGVLVGGNWKSNGTQESILKLSQGLKSMHVPEGVEVVVSPMLLHTSAVLSTLGSTSRVAVASQNCSAHNDGAYTGEVSAFALVDSGLPWVILGHSERRALFGDTDEVVGVKLAKALEAGLKVFISFIIILNCSTRLFFVWERALATENMVKLWRSCFVNFLRLMFPRMMVWSLPMNPYGQLEQVSQLLQTRPSKSIMRFENGFPKSPRTPALSTAVL